MGYDITFNLGDKLPYISEAVNAIYSYAPGKPTKETVKRKAAINAYSCALIEIWSKALGSKYIQLRKAVGDKLRVHLKSYYNAVINVRKNTSAPNTSQRQRTLSWRLENDILLDFFQRNVNIDDDLKFNKETRDYYHAQKNSPLRTGYISDQIDESYVSPKAPSPEPPEDRSEIESNHTEAQPHLTYQSINRSGFSRISKTLINQETQTDKILIDQPEIRGKRKLTDDIKKTCTQVSIECGISLEKARKAVQVVSRELYNHEYFLEPPLQNQVESQVSTESNACELPLKKSYLKWTPEVSEKYKLVIPSRRTLIEWKHLQATEAEIDAAIALFKKQEDIYVTLHYDTTSRNSIDGEWASIILNFSNNRQYSLRSIYFSYEDRNNIVRLICETYKRLATAASTVLKESVTPSSLWQNTCAFMTDAVSKNLDVEKLVSQELGSNHIPHHLLCKSHTVEGLDTSNIQVLASLELDLKMRQGFEELNPNLKSWFRGERAVFLAGIKCLINLISHDKSGHSTNLAEEFDQIVARENQVKHIGLYQERRFTKLGYVCAALLDAMPMICTLLTETHLVNQHVEAARMYIHCEFFHTELKVIAYFSYNVTLPFLNFVEKSSQNELLETLPKLYEDLKNYKTNTLAEFHVKYTRISVENLTEDLELLILEKLCTHAANAIHLQCGREYNLDAEEANVKDRGATKLQTLPPELLEVLPTNNLKCERQLSEFDRRAVFAKTRNRNFKARGIRDDMVLFSEGAKQVDRVTRYVHKLLYKKEIDWTKEQKELQQQRVLSKMEKAVKTKEYQDRLLIKCKSWHGPCTNIEELELILKKNPDPDKQEYIVRIELAYYRQCHRSDIIYRKELYRLRGISHEERLENILILLGGSIVTLSSNARLPTNKEALQLFPSFNPDQDVQENDSQVTIEEDDSQIMINKIYVTLWDEVKKHQWYLAYCVSCNDDGTFTMDHMHRLKKSCSIKWKYPDVPDICKVEADQILTIKPAGKWDFTIFNISNADSIIEEFQKPE